MKTRGSFIKALVGDRNIGIPCKIPVLLVQNKTAISDSIC